MSKISIERMLEINDEKQNPLKIRLLNERGLEGKISTYDVNRPGMALFGHYEYFAYDRIQLFGRGESNYLGKVYESGQHENDYVENLFNYEIPLFLFSNDIAPPLHFIEKANEADIAVIVSKLSTSRIIHILTNLLEDEFASSTTVHGVFIEVFGVGVLLRGKSGVGKSEVTLELIERGHRLVADDSVEFRRISDELIVGRSNKMLMHNMEVRGIGIVDIARLSGISAIRNRKKLDLIVLLEDWVEGKQYNRTGLDDKYEEILGVDIPYLCLAVRPGRNICILIETAAKNQRLKDMGYNCARELNKKMIDMMKKKKEKQKENK